MDQPESRPFDREPPPAAVFPMTDDAAGKIASVPQRRRRRRLVDTDSDVSEASPVQVVRRQGEIGQELHRHRSIHQSRLSQTRNRTARPTPRALSREVGSLKWRAKSRSASFPEPPVPAVVVPVERFNRSFEWLAGVDLVAVFSQRPCLMKSVPGFHERGLQVNYTSCSYRN